MSDLLLMGGHGAYVWSAYAISCAALLGICVWPLARLRKLRAKLLRRMAEEARAGR